MNLANSEMTRQKLDSYLKNDTCKNANLSASILTLKIVHDLENVSFFTCSRDDYRRALILEGWGYPSQFTTLKWRKSRFTDFIFTDFVLNIAFHISQPLKGQSQFKNSAKCVPFLNSRP